MVADRKQPTSDPGAPRRAPEWADGLKQLYDSVVEEELPDSFKDLLARLDEVDPKRGPVQASDPAQSPDGRGGRP